jgi:hypothetical protein
MFHPDSQCACYYSYLWVKVVTPITIYEDMQSRFKKRKLITEESLPKRVLY